MRYIPLGRRAIVRQLEEKTKVAIPGSVMQAERALGEIVAVKEDEGLKPGDRIIYNEFYGSYVPYEQDLLILNIDDILAIKKDE